MNILNIILFILIIYFIFLDDCSFINLNEKLNINYKKNFEEIKKIAKNINNCNIMYNNIEAKTKNIIYANQTKMNKLFTEFKISNIEIIGDETYKEAIVNFNYNIIVDKNKKNITGSITYPLNGNVEACNIKLGNYKNLIFNQ